MNPSMRVYLGKDGLGMTQQNEFSETIECVHCKGESRIGFVACETPIVGEKEEFVCDRAPNDDGYWVHDCCSVAVYFCKECLETTSIYNQS